MFSSKFLHKLGLAAAFLLTWNTFGVAQVPMTGAGLGSPDDTSGDPVSNACTASSGTTITFTAQGVGAADPRRISVVSINWSDSTAAGTAELNGVTVGGLVMARAVRASGNNQNSNSEIWYVANPTGISANVVATFSTAVDGITIEVYRLIGYQSINAITTGTTSVSQAYTNKQIAIAAGSRTVNVSTSLSNMTNDFSSACGSGLWGVHASQRLSGNGTLSSSISPTSNNPKIALAVWKTTADSPPLDGLTFTGAWSASRKLYTAYGGSFYNITSGRVDTFYDQSGNSRDLTQAVGVTRPIVDTSTATTALYFNGTPGNANNLSITTSLSNFLSAGSGYMVATVKNLTFQSDSPALPYTNAAIMLDSGQNAGMTVSNNSGAPLVYAINNGAVSGSILANVTYVIEWRHESGTLYKRINGANETSAADGNTNLTGTFFRMGWQGLDALVFEAAITSTIPTLAQRDAIALSFGLRAGAF